MDCEEISNFSCSSDILAVIPSTFNRPSQTDKAIWKLKVLSYLGQSEFCYSRMKVKQFLLWRCRGRAKGLVAGLQSPLQGGTGWRLFPIESLLHWSQGQTPRQEIWADLHVYPQAWGFQLPAKTAVSESSKTLQSANIEETFPSKEGQNQWPISLWSCQKCDQDWHGGKTLPPLKWHCWHLNLMALFSLNVNCVAAAKESLSKESSFIDLRENLIWEICHQHSPLPQTPTSQRKLSDHSQTVSTSMGVISVDFVMSFLSPSTC